MNTERIVKVINFLNDLPPEHFSLATVTTDASKETLQQIANTKTRIPYCGTTACLFGWFPGIFPEDYEWATPARHDGPVRIKAIDSDAHIDFQETIKFYLDLPSQIVSAISVDNHILSRLRGEGMAFRTTPKELGILLQQLLDGEVDESNYKEKWKI